MNAILEQINSMGKEFVEFAFPMLVQSSVLIVILLLVDLTLRKRVRAVFRYCIWMLVLAKLVLPSSLSSPLSFGYLFGDSLENVTVSRMTTTAETGQMPQPLEMPREGEARFVEAISAAPIVTPTTEGIEPVLEAAGLPVASMGQVTWQGVVFLVWLVVVGAMVLLLLQRALFVRGLVAQAKNANSLMNDAFKYCCRQMGMKGEVGLKVSANAMSPAVCGLFRSVILVPQNLGPSLGSSHLRAVLLHELAHIKRRDLWVNLVQTILQIIYFYNPLLWLANSIIRRVREQAVDETVQVAMGERAQQYPETLVNVAKLAFKRPALSLRLIGVVESKSALKGRIKHLLNRPIPKSAKLGILGLIVVLIVGAILLPMATSAAGPAGFVIKGTVTDAETGQPIGGAKVGDVDKYADGRQWTITDSDGKYSYATWYEEHGIKAEVPGYKIQHKGLYTKLFGSEKEKVLDFQLTPEDVSGQSQFKATLSSGVTVELVGVCDWTNGEMRKWRPDGTPLNQDIYLEKAHFEKWDDNFGFFAKFTGPEDMSTKWLGISGATHSSSTYPIFDRQGDKLKGHEGATGKIVDGQVSTSIRFGGATGPWRTIAEFDGKRKISGEDDVVFSRPIVSKNGTVIAVRGEWVFDGVRRIIATDTQGKDHNGGWSGRSSSEHTLATTEFHNLSPQQIQSYKVQFRPYECVEFKNVSLQPGVKSDVEVVVEKPGAKLFGELLKKAVTVNVDHGPDNDRLSVQYAVIAVCEAAGVPYKWEKSARLADPERRKFIEPMRVKRVTGAKALEDILKPVGLRYGLDDDGLYIYRSTDSHKLGEKTATEKEGKDRKGEILAKLVNLSKQRGRIQRDMDYAERALQDVRTSSGFTDLEERRSYRHLFTERLMRLEKERDDCHLEIAQLRANVKNLGKREAAEELKNAAILEGKLEALDKMIEEAKAQKRDFDRARVQYKQRARIRDERQLILDSLKGQIEKLRMVYDEVEASEEQLEVERALTEKEGKDRKGEILAKLRALSEHRNRIQRDLAGAERALQEVRVESGFTDLEERSYRHPVTERLMRLEQERDNCHLEIAQLKANIENLLKQPDSPEGKEKLKKVKDNLTVLEGKLEALNQMVEEAKARKRDLDLARVQYKRRARIRDGRQRMLDSLKAQVEKWKIAYDEAERAKADVETERR